MREALDKTQTDCFAVTSGNALAVEVYAHAKRGTFTVLTEKSKFGVSAAWQPHQACPSRGCDASASTSLMALLHAYMASLSSTSFRTS